MSQTIGPTSPEVKGHGWPSEQRAGLEAGRKKGREAVLWRLLGRAWSHLSCGYTCRIHEYQWRWSSAILHVTRHIFLRVNTFPPIEALGGKGEMSRMRVGCSLKTKDGLLDIWTSTPDYIKLYAPRGRSADRFKALVCLYITNSQGTQSWASVSICEVFYGEDEINQKLTSASESTFFTAVESTNHKLQYGRGNDPRSMI